VRRLTVQVRINDAGALSLPGRHRRQRLGDLQRTGGALDLPRASRSTLHGIAGSELVSTVSADDRRGPAQSAGLTLSVLPGRYIAGPGVLGLDWLGTQGLVLDFARRQMRLGSIVNRTDAERDGAGQGPAQRPAPDRRLGGRRQVLAFLDTGSTTTVGNMALMPGDPRGRPVSDWADISCSA
jgi:hypothetical protein